MAMTHYASRVLAQIPVKPDLPNLGKNEEWMHRSSVLCIHLIDSMQAYTSNIHMLLVLKEYSIIVIYMEFQL